MSLYEHRHVGFHSDPENSISKRLALLVRLFDRKDLSSHTFRKKELRGGNGINFDGIGVIDTPPRVNYPQSPSPFPNHTQRNCLSGEEGGTLPPE